ncbi:MAG: hypothetical protein DI533_19490 [Cereibacter sphaeroides]|uniref:Cyclic nucleotide-binding domain-containing protein n=1 Tax=Cereibacter sphaeroides TaxID=1063 RepID=A0A2W5RXY7_CERSP|nr:MAG: hypothetical protein DI533_19490 [Cereibacter sphaeroides]
MLAEWSQWFVTSGIPEKVGVLGVIFYLGSYLSLQLGLLKGDGYLYPALNLAGSSAVLISLTTHFNPFSATIESSWIVISLIGLARLYYVNNYLRHSDEEAEVVARLVPGLKTDRAKQVLKLGRFVDGEAGQVLATQGVPIKDLAMLLSGQAAVERGTTVVAAIGANALVGELTFATGGPATATVRLTEPSRLFLIGREELLAFLARNPDVTAEMERSIAGDLRAKLVSTTDLLHSRLAGQGEDAR